MAKGINEIFYVNYEKAERNLFRDASKASEFLLSQLNSVSEEELFSEGFCWSGDECMVPASTLNSVLRSLEAVGVHESVVVIPAMNGGPNPAKWYMMKPYMYNPEYPVKVGIAVSDDI